MAAITESISDTSTRWPRPVTVRAFTAARMPMARCRPPRISPSALPARVGPAARRAVMAIMPPMAWARMS